jgi:hypothetical protein
MIELDMSFPILSFVAPIIALAIGGAITLALDYFYRSKP